MKHEDFPAFFSRDYPHLVRHVRMLGYDRESASDAAQQAMTLLLEQADRVSRPSTWVRVTARRVALRDRARDEKRDQLYAREAAQAPIRTCPDPEEAVAEKGEARRVLKIIRQLPPQQRQVLAWHYDGFSAQEIADVLDLKRSTVDSNLRHARERVRALYTQPVLVGEGRHYERPSV
ncbi:RNA polymerase sigma factor [Streptomyces sp. NPDC102340]|uniref:RNA polymerase sigma factor n=1 Tax=unclassified Streptomyces TaxID=2593676 RepID=UPI003824C102